MESADVIVIGAGPAGAMAARECAKRGLTTTLIEKESIPRPKICGGGVTLKAIELIGQEIPSGLIDQYVRGFRIYSPLLDSFEFISKDSISISTTRDKFDSFLARLATLEGCELIERDQVVDLRVLRDKTVCRLQSGRSVEGRMIIGADGVDGITARKVGLRERWKSSEVALCLEATIPLTEKQMSKLDSGLFELYFVDSLAGYGWLIPKRSSTSLGIGGLLSCLHRPRELLETFCRTISNLKNIKIDVSKFGAHLVPAGGFERNVVSDRVILVGDAAGFVDPLMGEGIYYAMRSGLLAATASAEAIDENDFAKSFLEKHYSVVCERSFGKDLKAALDLTYRIHTSFGTFFDLLKRYPAFSGPYVAGLACGRTTYRKLDRRIHLLLMARSVERNLVKLLSMNFLM